jgi:hypothetical protein
MKFTHEIDFFSNSLNITIDNGFVADVEDDGETCLCCSGCEEEIADYWMVLKQPDGTLLAKCPTADCDGGDWPVTELVTSVKKKK